MSPRVRFAVRFCLALASFTAFLTLIDPRLAWLRAPSVVVALAAGGFVTRRDGLSLGVFCTILATLLLAVASWSEPDWCCDATAYYIYDRSLLFDQDLDFANEWAAFGENPAITITGRAINAHSIGPALLWSPTVLVAHAYVLMTRALHLSSYSPDGYSLPYLRATAAGTVLLVTLGIAGLWRACVRRFSPNDALPGIAFCLLASVLPYYVFVVPSVSHGAVFATASWFVAWWVRIEKTPSLRAWVVLGALLGLVSLCRWQAVVLGILFIPLFISAARARIFRWTWILGAVAASATAFAPQAVAWRVLFGSPFALPTGVHGMDWRAPHLLDVLFSADRGLFTWTPLMGICTLGWLWLARDWPGFAVPSAMVFAATTWVNGGVAVWSGGDAYGARRFDLILPLWAIGLTAFLSGLRQFILKRPLAVPALVLSAFALWNTGLMRLHRKGVFIDAAPLEEVAGRQVGLLRKFSEEGLGAFWGPAGRNFAYKVLVGRYFYWNTGFNGRVDLGSPDDRYLAGGWSDRVTEGNERPYRFAGASPGCVKVPFERPFDLILRIEGRSVAADQTVRLEVNRALVGTKPVAVEWSETEFRVASSSLVPGENLFCAAFSSVRPNGRAAAVRAFQFP